MKLLLAFFVLINAAYATPQEYAKYYNIDLLAPLPNIETLTKKYITDNPDHDRKYEHNFLIGTTFDKIFKQTINTYGSSEKRLKTANEDALIQMLNSVPKSSWQYIGPYLHTAPGISEKILNMPGIKETKNKFPQKIAPQLQDLENLEFLSPHMYFLLMPEIWPDNLKTDFTIPKQKIFNPKVKRDDAFFNKLKSLSPRDAYANPSLKDKKTQNDLRTTKITPNSLLTSGDVKAFIQTMPSINKYANQGQKEKLLQIAQAGSLLDIYEQEKGTALPINSLKDVVNPCQREVQKIIVAGLYQEFYAVVAKHGFTPETWAVTCDKTLKAYRVATMSLNTIIALKQYKLGVYNEFLLKNLNKSTQAAQFATLQSIIEMNSAPKEDVFSAAKHIKELGQTYINSGSQILTSPIVY